MDGDAIIKFVIKLNITRQYHSIQIIIANSSFSNSDLSVDIVNYPLSSFTVTVSNVSFNTGILTLTMPLMESIKHPEQIDEWSGAHVLITGCTFVKAEVGIELTTFSNCRENLDSVAMKHPEIVISHTRFENYYPFGHFMVNPCKLRIVANTLCELPTTSHGMVLTIQNNTFKDVNVLSNEAIPRPRSNTVVHRALFIFNLQRDRVILAGDNQIISNLGYGLMLINSEIELHGYNEINQNGLLKNRGPGRDTYVT